MEASTVSVPKTVKMGKPLIDLFASRVSHQFPTYVASRRDLFGVATNAFSITWNREFYHAFPLFLHNDRF